MTSLNVHDAASRFFRSYVAFQNEFNRDALFNWLESMHSLQDRIRSSGVNLLEFDEFRALKCLRNYFHHHKEVRHKLKVLRIDGVPLISDLMVVCLVPLQHMQSALAKVGEKYREQVR